MTKEKVLALALAFPDVAIMSDKDICLQTGLEITDLDKCWNLAETCYLKAIDKPEIKPEGEALVAEIKSWVEYYFRD